MIKDCWTAPTQECFNVGLGPESFDCSGFVISSLCESQGIDISSWRRDVRHVREFWNDSNSPIGEVIEVEHAQIGDLLIFKKIITVEGIKDFYPCHTSIVTTVTEDCLKSVGTSVKDGEVVETEVSARQMNRVLGAIVLDHHKIFN